MADVELGRLYVGLEGRDINLSAMLARARQDLVQTGQGGKTLQNNLRDTSGIDALAGKFVGFATQLGLVTTAVGAVKLAWSTAREGLELSGVLDENRRAIGAFLGDVDRGNKIFQSAISFGKQYGYTQREMADSARALAPLLQYTRTETEKQLNVLGRLASLNPEEGFKGAVFSTKELASGDITSIVERFNLSRAAARQMKEEIAAGADVVDVLDRQLTKMGVTSEILSQRTQGVAGAERNLKQAHEELSLAIGNLVSGPGTAFLNWLAEVERRAATALNGRTDQANQRAEIAKTAQSYKQYLDMLDQLRAKNVALYGQRANVQIQPMTEAEFNYARALMASGTAQDEATQKAQQYGVVVNQIVPVQQRLTAEGQLSEQQIANIGFVMVDGASKGTAYSATVQELTRMFINGQLTGPQYAAALNQVAGAHVQGAATARDQAAAERELQAAMAAKDISSSIGIYSDSTLKNQQRAQVAQLQANITTAKDHKDKLLALEAWYNHQVETYGSQSAEAIAAQAQMTVERQTTIHKTGGGVKLGNQQKFDNNMLNLQDQYADQSEARERDHQRNLVAIEREGQERRAEQMRRNEISKRASRADFYDQLAEQDFDTSRFSAAYEEAYAKSQEIAQQGNHKLSEDYLAMRQRQIQADEEYARKAKEIQDSDLSNKEKQGKLQQLEALRKMREEANAEEEKQLLAAGDDINNDLQKRLDDENRRYQESVDEAGNKFDALADRRIAAYQRANTAIANTTPAELTQAQRTGLSVGGQTTPTTPTSAAPKASEALSVRDDGVASAIGNQTGELKSALESVRRAVEGVERAVGRIDLSGAVR